MGKRKVIHSVNIDPNNDFTKKEGSIQASIDLLPADFESTHSKEFALLQLYNSAGSLYVPGAEISAANYAAFVDNYGDVLDDIHVTLDNHHIFDVAHPRFWVNAKGENPAPFTQISHNDVKNKVWEPFIPNLPIAGTKETLLQRMLAYTKALQDNDRYQLTIWPEHCIIGTHGAAVYESIRVALHNWETTFRAQVNYVIKGSNIYTEHYSAIQADVPDPADSTTLMNTKFINVLNTADIILISGQARTHCVPNTFFDVVTYAGDDIRKKFIFLEDTSDDVPGFETLAKDWIDMMIKGDGMKVSDTQSVHKYF